MLKNFNAGVVVTILLVIATANTAVAQQAFSSSVSITSDAPFEAAADHQSVTLEWTTDSAAHTVVRYGLTADFELGVLSEQSPVTNHTFTLNSLEPATIYKVQVGAAVDADTVWSAKQIISSGSHTTATQQVNVYFSGSVDETVANGTLATANFNMANHYIYRINEANHSIDIALHNLSQNTGTAITNALIDAAQRGVQIRMVTEDKEGDPAQENFDLLEQEPNINMIARNVSGLMHNKFAIFDFHGGSPQDIWVITSSWNSTDTGNNNEFQNMIEFQDPALAGGYLAEFNQMYGSSGFTPDPGNARFANSKEVVNPTRFWVDGKQVDLFFSPQANTEAEILKKLETAQQDVILNLNLVTRSVYIDQLFSLHNNGVHVKGSIGAPWFENTLFQQLRSFSDVYDHNASDAERFLHSKVALIDASNYGNGNAQVITGSMNWSGVGNTSNDENTIVIKDELIANFFYQEAMARYAESEEAYDPDDDGDGGSVPFLPGQGGIQLWSINFGEEVKTHSSGESSSFVQQPQPFGGETRVRIGGGNQIRISDSDNENEAGNFSGMILEASPTGGRNFFEIGRFDASPMLYTKQDIHISAQGANNFIYLWVGGNDRFDSNDLGHFDAFALVRFDINANGINTAYRNQSNSSWNIGELGSTFQTGETYTVEFYANNSESSETYYRDATSYELQAGEWSIWVDGEHIQTRDGIQDALSPGDKLDTIRYYGGKTHGEHAQLNIDNIFYSNRLPDYRTITGHSGWKMLSAPAGEIALKQLVRQNLTQGFEGAYDENADLNLYTGYNGETFTAAEHEEDHLEIGHGFIWYVWDNANTTASQKLPFGMLLAGSRYTDNITVDLNEDNWTLLGNPYPFDLDVSNIQNWVPDGQSIEPTVQVWTTTSDNTGTYQLSTSNNHKIAAWQGFFIESISADQLTFEYESASSGATLQKQNRRNDRSISLRLSGTDETTGALLEDRAAVIYFHPDIEQHDNTWNATKLTPLSARYVTLEFDGMKNGEPVSLAQQGLPFTPEAAVTIPVQTGHSGDLSGDFQIELSALNNVPDSWQILLHNTETGTVTNLRNNPKEIRLQANQTAQKTFSEITTAPPPFLQKQKVGNDSAFELQVIPHAADDTGTLPGRTALHQNYPNPFNPVTIISFELPENGNIRLDLYDMLGRRVQTLYNGHANAGTHQVELNASGLASGVYLYKLSAPSATLTRFLTITK